MGVLQGTPLPNLSRSTDLLLCYGMSKFLTFFVQISQFRYSAWEFNEKRGQYYLHQFVVGQPDINYRNENLRNEMKVCNRLHFHLNLK